MKKLFPIWYFLMHINPLIVILGIYFEMPIFFLCVFGGTLLILGALDILMPRDSHFSYEEVISISENDGRFAPWIYEIATISYFTIYLIALGMALYTVQFEHPFIAWFFYFIPLGLSSTKIMNLCHEYFHKNNKIEKGIARFFLSLLLYNYLEYEHLHSHHNNEITCTQQDIGTGTYPNKIFSQV